MAKYKIRCHIGNSLTERVIECREMTIDSGSYCFWTGKYGETNKLVYAFPVVIYKP